MAFETGVIKKVYNDLVGGTAVKKVVYQYGIYDDWQSEMPDQGDLIDGYYFLAYSQAWPNPVYTEITTRWSEEEDWFSSLNISNADTLNYADASSSQEPIETHPDFLMQWAYDLFQRKIFDVAIPAFFATATTKIDGDGVQWLWSKTHPGDKWRLAAVRTKPGVESYLKPRFISRSESYYRDKTDAEAVLQTVDKISAPDDAFGYTEGDFLAEGVNLRYDGRYWVAVSEHLHSPDGWDTDIYELLTTTTA